MTGMPTFGVKHVEATVAETVKLLNCRVAFTELSCGFNRRLITGVVCCEPWLTGQAKRTRYTLGAVFRQTTFEANKYRYLRPKPSLNIGVPQIRFIRGACLQIGTPHD